MAVNLAKEGRVMSYTPGPWKVDARLLGTVKDATGDTIATVGTNVDGAPQANARLIAAAPDLLAALEGAERVLDWHIDNDCDAGLDTRTTCASVRAAIKKAKERGVMSHTPRRWTVTELDPAPEPGFAYAIGHDPLSESDVPWPIALACMPADARLIAAAPDLLAALERLEAETNGEHGCVDCTSAPSHCAWCQARAAIDKAKGES